MAIVQFVALVAVWTTAANAANCQGDGPTKELCKCILGCDVNGGDSGECSDDIKKNSELLVQKAQFTDEGRLCDSLKCGAYCQNSLKCEDLDTTGCEAIKGLMKTGCDVDCNGVGQSTTVLSFATLLLAAIMQF